MSSSGSGSSSSGSGSSGSRIPISRRNAIRAGAGAGAVGLLGGLGLGLTNEVEISGYEDQSEFNDHRRSLEGDGGERERLNNLRNEYGSISNIGLSTLLEGEDIRIGLSDKLNSTTLNDSDSRQLQYSDNPENTGGNLPKNIVADPSYIISFEGEDTTREIVGRDPALERVFTSFDGTDIDLNFEEDIVKEYNLDIEKDKEAAKEAFEGAKGARVMAPTDIETQQPIGLPATLESALEDIESLENELENIYSEATDNVVDNYQNELKNGLEDAKNRKGIFGIRGSIENRQQAEELLETTNELNEEYQDFTDTVAADLARTRVVKEAFERAHDRAEEIYENSRLSDLFHQVEVEGEEMTGIKLGEVRNWDSITAQYMGEDEYFQSEAERMDGLRADQAGEMILTYDGDDTYLVNPNNGHAEEAHMPEGEQLFNDLIDGVYDGSEL